MSLSVLQRCLLVGHLALAAGVVALVAMPLDRRDGELATLRSRAASERQETVHLRQEVARLEAVRDGLKRDDPYVVEAQARQRLDLMRPGEIRVPPLPAADAVDKPPSPGRQ